MHPDIRLSGLQPYLSFLGSFIQFGSSILLVALFLLLRPYARRRRYFGTWSQAWIILSLALFTVMVRYNVLAVLPDGSPTDNALRVRALYFLYQLFKIGFYGFLVAGTLRYVRSAPRFPSIAGFGAFALLYSTLSLIRSPSLAGMVVWQTPIAVATLGYAAYLMLTLPPSRRSLGGSVIGVCYAFGAVVWALYLAAFGQIGKAGNPLIFIVNYNTYLDLAWQLALGFGMVVLLLEDVKHEVDAAHAELAVAHDNLRRASFYDSVTGSLNRQAFAEGLGLESALAGFGSVAMLDLDNLKDINDRHGHACGDGMLRYTVEVLRAHLRASDKLYRWGGDEFLLVFPGGDATHVSRRLKRILTESEPFHQPGDVVLPIRVSVGAAGFTSSEQLTAAIDAADRAMYADKAGRKAKAEADIPQSA